MCHKAKVKGQFFILGAILLCALFYIGLPLYGPLFHSSRNDISFVSGNLEKELPLALNLGLKAGSGIQNLADFSGFARSRLSGQGMGFKSLWVVAEPDSLGLNVTVGNFMGEDISATVTIVASGQVFNVADGFTRSKIFSGVPNSFQITVDFPGRSWSGLWLSNKVGMYAFTEISKGGDVAIKEIEA